MGSEVDGVEALTFRDRITQTSLWTWTVVLLCVCSTVATTRLQWDIHRGLGTSSFDVGLYDQGIWLLSRFEAPFVTLMGRNLLGDHASLILLLVAPLYWIWPGTETLLALQSFVVAAGALPIYFFARRHLNSAALGCAFAVVWLVNPAVNGTIFENYHPDSFLGLFVPVAIVSALTKRWRWYWVAVILSLLVKEDVVLVIVPLGAMLAIRGETRRGILTIGVAISAALLGMFVLMKNLIGVPTRNGWRIPFGGFSGFIKESFTNPTNVIEYLTSEGRLMYWWKMFAPFALLSLLAPEVAMISVLVLVGNTVSNFWYQFHIEYHYSLVAVPALLIATIVGVGRLGVGLRRGLVAVVVVSSLWSASVWSYVPFRLDKYPHWGAEHPVAAAADEMYAAIPPKAKISVFHSTAPHLAHRKEIYQFPNPFRIVMYGPDTSTEGQRSPLADGIEFVLLPRVLDKENLKDWNDVSADFYEYKANNYWQLFARKAP
ncbi:MAG: DUF2079 domain-containing protein [Ilumatobacteraceae bacterium]|nr:DUF2079 domain-containing protein [Ilumatobacteraceae bacterium]